MKQDESYESLILDNEHATCTPKITVREQQILQLCAKGMTTAEIAITLHRAESTINFHFFNLRAKFGTRCRHATVLKALKFGILTHI